MRCTSAGVLLRLEADAELGRLEVVDVPLCEVPPKVLPAFLCTPGLHDEEPASSERRGRGCASWLALLRGELHMCSLPGPDGLVLNVGLMGVMVLPLLENDATLRCRRCS